MDVRLLTSAPDLQAYDQWVKQHPDGMLWQSLEWKKYREACGKEVRIYGKPGDATALVVIDRTSMGWSTWDIPRGPLATHNQLLKMIVENARREGCMNVTWSPLKALNLGVPSGKHVQAEATRIVDLRLPEAEILVQMHEKGRYNIKVAQKHGIVIKESDDLDAWMKLITETSSRNGFTPVNRAKYEAFLKYLSGSFMLLAYETNNHKPETSNLPIAGLIGVTWNGTGIYYYGASSYEHRNLMAPYLLQWEAMKKCKALGCHSYDLLGVAPVDAKPDHPWQGISSFKAKFSGQVISYPPEQEIVLKPMMKTLLGLKRKILG